MFLDIHVFGEKNNDLTLSDKPGDKNVFLTSLGRFLLCYIPASHNA